MRGEKLDGQYRIRIIPTIVVSLLVLITYSIIATSVVSGVRDLVDSGYLDDVEELDNGNISYRGEEREKFARYKYAVLHGEDNDFTFSEDGFVYIDTLGVGRKSFVFDYKWYGGVGFNKEKVVDYIDNNYKEMVLRNIVYSNQYVTFVVIAIGLSLFNKYLIPIFTQMVASLFGFIRVIKLRILGEEKERHIKVYESRLIRKVVERYERSYSLGYLSMGIAFIISLYSKRYEEELAIYVAFYINTIIGVLYILNIVAVNHIKIIKENRGE